MVKEFIVTSMPETVDALAEYVRSESSTGQHLRVTVAPTRLHGISQRALAHVWIRNFAEMWDMESDLQQIKFVLKLRCYRETNWDFMLTDEDEPQSIAKMDRGQLFMFMDWLQSYGAREGLVLVSRGEHKQLKELGG